MPLKCRLTHSSFQTKLLPVDLASGWLALSVLSHPIAALNAIDGYSILLTPDADKTGMATSISVSQESAGPEQSGHPTIEGNGNGDVQGKRGLQNFVCFQYSDTLVTY
jgi:hypothetical protein